MITPRLRGFGAKSRSLADVTLRFFQDRAGDRMRGLGPTRPPSAAELAQLGPDPSQQRVTVPMGAPLHRLFQRGQFQRWL